MANIYDLVDVVKQSNGNEVIKAILPNRSIVDVGVQQYVESGIYFMFAKDSRDGIQTVAGLKGNLEYEASDECWRTDCCGIFDDGRSHFLDCEVCFSNCDCDKFFDSDDDMDDCVFDVYGITVEDGVVYLHCEEDFVNENQESISSIAELTSDEREMIKKALNYYGDKIADSQGYSSGEPYWDLMNRF